MREIKFRAWIKEENVMIDVPILNFRDKTIKTLYTQPCDKWEYQFEEIELMQFTGLYDKNKVPIYEGDIVRYFENECAYIYWNKDRMAWGIEPIDKEVYFDSPYLSDNTNIEVIGNIYDNPDLLGA